jgi:hypothetical protein
VSIRVAARGLMATAAREVSERVTLLGLAAALALVPFVAPWAGLGDRPLLGAFVFVVMVVAAALLTGSSVIARDLAEGRLGFFLARPQPWWSIWGGKMLAATVLTFAAGAIILLPAALAGYWQPPGGGWWLAILAPGLLALIGLAHALAVAYRARTPWFALDLAMIVGLGAATVTTARELMRWGAWLDLDTMSVLLWLLAAGFVVAGAVQVAQGGADIRRGHRVLSLVVWSLVTPSVAGFVAWAAWVQRPTPADLGTVVAAWPAPEGPWIAAAGRARWPRPASLMPTLLVDEATGRFIRTGPAFSVRGPVFSEDGTRAAWVTDWWSETRHLMVADLRASHPEASALPLPVPPGAVYSIALSADGSAAAVVQPTQVTVFVVGSAQTAVVARTRTSFQRQAIFTPDGRVHVLGRRDDPLSPGLLDVLVLDPAARRASVTGQIATRGNAFEHWSPGARRVAAIHRPDRRPSLTLHDGATAALLATLVAEGAARSVSASFLRDGRLAVVEAGHGVRLRVFTPDGAESVSVDVATGFAPAGVAEAAPGVLAVELPFYGPSGATDTVLVDAKSGRVIRREKGLRPAEQTWFARGATAPEAVPASLFIDERGALVRLDVALGPRRVVLGGP